MAGTILKVVGAVGVVIGSALAGATVFGVGVLAATDGTGLIIYVHDGGINFINKSEMENETEE